MQNLSEQGVIGASAFVGGLEVLALTMGEKSLQPPPEANTRSVLCAPMEMRTAVEGPIIGFRLGLSIFHLFNWKLCNRLTKQQNSTRQRNKELMEAERGA